MAKETKNLKLHQVTRPEDDSKAFNLETMLNENWEKLDSAVGDLSQPVTAAEGSAIGLRVQNGRLQYKNNESWTELGLEYEDVKNLAARPDGLVTWALPQSTDNTRTAIVLCRASKDITNLGYAACLSDASITKNTLAQNATSNTYTGLTTSTQYWVKAFVKYALGGKEFYSGGVTVTFTTPTVTITEFYNAGNEFTSVTGAWVTGFGSENGQITKSSSNVYIKGICSIQYGAGVRGIQTNNAINLNNLNIKKIKAEIVTQKLGIGNFVLSASLDKFTRANDDIVKYVENTPITQKYIVELDVTNATGPRYLKLEVGGFNSVGNYYEATITRVWGES